MRKLTVVIAAATVFAAVAVAEATTVNKIASVATVNHAGSKAKPAAFAASWTFDQSDSGGLRPPPPEYWRWQWKGVQTNGAHFPKCTAAMIDAKQSDSVCPKGSLVGSIAIKALVGPANDRSVLGATCTGKVLRIYTAGPKDTTFFAVGPASTCAGVAYLPPIDVKLSTKGGTTQWSFLWPDNLTHALPGVEGALINGTAKFPVVKAKDGTPFLTSSSCTGGKRGFQFTLVDENGTANVPSPAGACSK